MAIHTNKNLAHLRNTVMILVLFRGFRELIMNIYDNVVIFTGIRTINTTPLLSDCGIQQPDPYC